MKASFFLTSFAILVCAGSAVANDISGPSGTSGSIFTALSVSDVQTSAQLVGSIATATFSNGSSVGCVFAANGVCNGSFFSLTPATNASLGTLGSWTIQNMNTGVGVSMTSLQVSLNNGAFNPCLAAGAVSASNSFCGNIGGPPQGGGTAGSGLGLSVSSDNSNFMDPNRAAASGTVQYTNAVQIGGVVSADLYTQILLTFTGTFTGGQNFTFQADTDLLNGGSGGPTGAPEPTTISLVGAALIGLGWLRHRSKQ